MDGLSNLQLAQVGTGGVQAALVAVKTSGQALLVSGKDLVGPPLTDLLTTVQGLQTTLGTGDQTTLGAKLVAVTTAIAQIKTDASSVQAALGTTCPAP